MIECITIPGESFLCIVSVKFAVKQRPTSAGRLSGGAGSKLKSELNNRGIRSEQQINVQESSVLMSR